MEPPPLQHIVIAVATLSFLVFTVFFGRLPVFRKTPIGFLHRLIWVHFPALLRRLDGLVTGGRIYKYTTRTWHYLLYEKHPLVLIFFLGLLTAASGLLLFNAYTCFPVYHRLVIPLVLPAPYVFTYLCATTRPNTVINASNHAAQMQAYPYDHILYHPNMTCRTCHLPKPARSKHCPICKTCVARMDHHCIWVNNCVGRENYRWFLALLLSTTLLLLYGAYLALVVYLYPQVYDRFTHYDHAFPAGLLSGWAPWKLRLLGFREDLNTVMVESIKVGGLSILGVGLLAALTWPLPLGLLAYHTYLIWAGMTTNEASKWADLRDQMRDGHIYAGKLWGSSNASEHLPSQRGRPSTRGGRYAHSRARATSNSFAEFGFTSGEVGRRIARENTQEKGTGSDSGYSSDDNKIHASTNPTRWPNNPCQVLVRTGDGEPPREVPQQLTGLVDEGSWKRVWRLADIENIYDLGFWDNLEDVLQG
ncbi:zf-dhhc-domain-containing protein [Diplodia corticola]|uniref:Palmitoyltransferase n=1 Tax=Diplodia corticola TaxID=236234 RepID=A0A1J9RR53_9PEZI|nr:zf-dhhc-domain-containing protein [Diplodia corticola]OJD30380.1 zf-dhhc-domain-containing protein [Diplodia corticola]